MILQDFIELQLLCTEDNFYKKLSACAVLVRLDERGGPLEASQWAFQPVLAPKIDLSELKDLKQWVDDESKTTPDKELEKDIEPNWATKMGFDQETYTLTQAHFPKPYAGDAAHVYLLKKSLQNFRIGRFSESAEIVIDERCISRKHAEIHFISQHHFEVRDLGSYNGTSLHRQKCGSENRYPLASGDLIAFGEVQCLFLSIDDFYKYLPQISI